MKKLTAFLLTITLAITMFIIPANAADAEDMLLGDVNGDGMVTVSDATAIQWHLAEMENIPEERMSCAMVSEDDEISISDATLVQMYVAEMIDRFPIENKKKDTLVVVFSRTGHTKSLAEYAADYLDADLFEIEAAVPYTDADIAYYTNCRADQEQNDPTARPEIKGEVKNMEQYDTIVLAYPIWHGQAPKIIYTFLESYDFTGKTIIPFCTYASSGIGSSATNLHALAPDAVWKDGRRFAIGTSKETVENWLKTFE